jgi:hypothetical protein
MGCSFYNIIVVLDPALEKNFQSHQLLARLASYRDFVCLSFSLTPLGRPRRHGSQNAQDRPNVDRMYQGVIIDHHGMDQDIRVVGGIVARSAKR